jgi:hypothetical protein
MKITAENFRLGDSCRFDYVVRVGGKEVQRCAVKVPLISVRKDALANPKDAILGCRWACATTLFDSETGTFRARSTGYTTTDKVQVALLPLALGYHTLPMPLYFGRAGVISCSTPEEALAGEENVQARPGSKILVVKVAIPRSEVICLPGDLCAKKYPVEQLFNHEIFHRETVQKIRKEQKAYTLIPLEPAPVNDRELWESTRRSPLLYPALQKEKSDCPLCASGNVPAQRTWVTKAHPQVWDEPSVGALINAGVDSEIANNIYQRGKIGDKVLRVRTQKVGEPGLFVTYSKLDGSHPYRLFFPSSGCEPIKAWEFPTCGELREDGVSSNVYNRIMDIEELNHDLKVLRVDAVPAGYVALVGRGDNGSTYRDLFGRDGRRRSQKFQVSGSTDEAIRRKLAQNGVPQVDIEQIMWQVPSSTIASVHWSIAVAHDAPEHYRVIHRQSGNRLYDAKNIKPVEQTKQRKWWIEPDLSDLCDGGMPEHLAEALLDNTHVNEVLAKVVLLDNGRYLATYESLKKGFSRAVEFPQPKSWLISITKDKLIRGGVPASIASAIFAAVLCDEKVGGVRESTQPWPDGYEVHYRGAGGGVRGVFFAKESYGRWWADPTLKALDADRFPRKLTSQILDCARGHVVSVVYEYPSGYVVADQPKEGGKYDVVCTRFVPWEVEKKQNELPKIHIAQTGRLRSDVPNGPVIFNDGCGDLDVVELERLRQGQNPKWNIEDYVHKAIEARVDHSFLEDAPPTKAWDCIAKFDGFSVCVKEVDKDASGRPAYRYQFRDKSNVAIVTRQDFCTHGEGITWNKSLDAVMELMGLVGSDIFPEEHDRVAEGYSHSQLEYLRKHAQDFMDYHTEWQAEETNLKVHDLEDPTAKKTYDIIWG